jgi:hypothetical protein
MGHWVRVQDRDQIFVGDAYMSERDVFKQCVFVVALALCAVVGLVSMAIDNVHASRDRGVSAGGVTAVSVAFWKE